MIVNKRSVLATFLLLCGFEVFVGEKALSQPNLSFTKPAEITIGIDHNYPPFCFRDSEGSLQGLLVDLWKEWSKITGIKCKLIGMDWEEVLWNMREGRFDAIDTAFRTKEREQYMDFSSPYQDIEVPIFFHRDISGIVTAKDLQGFVVGVKKGDAVVGFLQSQGIYSLREFVSYEAIAAAAKLGSIRIFSIDKPSGLYYLNKFELVDLFRITPPLYTGQLHRAVRKGNGVLLSLIEDGFAKVPPSVQKKLEEKWFGRTLHPPLNIRLLITVLSVSGLIILLLLLWAFTLRRAVRARTAELEAEKEYVSALFNFIGEGIILFNAAGTILSCNRSFERLIGFPLSRFLPLPLKVFCGELSPYTETEAREIIRKTFEEGPQRVDWQAPHRKGQRIPVEVLLRPVQIGGERRILASVRDISQRLRFIQQLTQSIAEKEALMRELVHRTKNNLQLVSSLVSLFLGDAKDPSLRGRVMELQSKIASIATVHEMLCGSPGGVGKVNMDGYLQRILGLITEGFHLELRNLQLTLDAAPLQVSPKTAVILGLIVNELVTNAVKHGFSAEQGGNIHVRLLALPSEENLLEVSDSGKGFPEGFDPAKSETIGLLTLYSLVEQQLKGTLSFTTAEPNGLTASIRFPSLTE